MKYNLNTIFAILLVLLIYPSITHATMPTEKKDLGAPSCGGEGYCDENSCYIENGDCPVYQYFANFLAEPQTAITLDNQKYSSCTIITKGTDAAGFGITNTIQVPASAMKAGVYNLALEPSAIAKPTIEASKQNTKVTKSCPSVPFDEATWNKLNAEWKKYGTLCKTKKITLVCTPKESKPPVQSTTQTSNQAPQNTANNTNHHYNIPITTNDLTKLGLDTFPNKKPYLTLNNLAYYINTFGQKYNVDPALIASIIKNESGGNPMAGSSAGAHGLMQLMPETAKENGVYDSYNPQDNIMGGVHYLSIQLNNFSTISSAVAAYNAGPGNAYAGFGETKQYVINVMSTYSKLTKK